MAGTYIPGLDYIATATAVDPGLKKKIAQWRIDAGVDGALVTNVVINKALTATGVNADHLLTPNELMRVADTIGADQLLYHKFVLAHGDDEGDLETGYHYVQNDGGTLMFQGRKFIDVVADAIGHIGFNYHNGVFVDEDGNANQRVADIAGWMNYFMNGVSVVWGSGGNDNLGSGRYSPVFKNAANETFRAGAGDDNVWADAGNDKILAGAGNDHAGGGSGADTIYGDIGNDSLSGEGGNDHLYGQSGIDNLSGGGGNDILAGGTGNDMVWGDDGDDLLSGGSGLDQMGGGAGNDRMFGGDSADKIYGDTGNDELHGGLANDEIGGGDGADKLYGDAGADSLNGGRSNDRLDGGDGNDNLWGDYGIDRMYGGNGNDSIGGGASNDYAFGGAGADTISGEDGDDTLNGDAGSDKINGDAGLDTLNGGDGNDSLDGGWGNDIISGGNGNDQINGGEGSDRIDGGKGVDTLEIWDQYKGRDTLVFRAGDSGTTVGTVDIVKDFVSGEDKIDLRSFGTMEFLPNGFAHTGGGLATVFFNSGNLMIDGDGNGATDMVVTFTYLNSLTADDFILA